MRKLSQQLFVGVIAALCGTGFYALMFSFLTGGSSELVSVLRLGMRVWVAGIWFVMPLGALLGWIVLRSAMYCPARRAFGRGLLLGAITAVLVASVTSVKMQAPIWGSPASPDDSLTVAERALALHYLNLVPVMIGVYAVLVGAWTAATARKAELDWAWRREPPPQHDPTETEWPQKARRVSAGILGALVGGWLGWFLGAAWPYFASTEPDRLLLLVMLTAPGLAIAGGLAGLWYGLRLAGTSAPPR